MVDELDEDDIAYYQSLLIGILRWMVNLGRIDISYEVLMMSLHMAMLRVGHLEQLFHIFVYLKRYHNNELVFDPSDRPIDVGSFKVHDWSASE